MIKKIDQKLSLMVVRRTELIGQLLKDKVFEADNNQFQRYKLICQISLQIYTSVKDIQNFKKYVADTLGLAKIFILSQNKNIAQLQTYVSRVINLFPQFDIRARDLNERASKQSIQQKGYSESFNKKNKYFQYKNIFWTFVCTLLTILAQSKIQFYQPIFRIVYNYFNKKLQLLLFSNAQLATMHFYVGSSCYQIGYAQIALRHFQTSKQISSHVASQNVSQFKRDCDMNILSCLGVLKSSEYEQFRTFMLKSIQDEFPPKDIHRINLYKSLGSIQSIRKSYHISCNYFSKAKEHSDQPNFVQLMNILILTNVRFLEIEIKEAKDNLSIQVLLNQKKQIFSKFIDERIFNMILQHLNYQQDELAYILKMVKESALFKSTNRTININFKLYEQLTSQKIIFLQDLETTIEYAGKSEGLQGHILESKFYKSLVDEELEQFQELNQMILDKLT